jgi:hypothetical protein
MITRNQIKTVLTLAAVAMAILVLTSASASAASMSASLTKPTIDGEDVANYGSVSGTDKWWNDSAASGYPKGQTFTTGSGAVWLNSLSYQVTDTQKAEPTKNYVIRVGTVYGSVFTKIYSETAAQTFTWNSSEYMTWTFDSPVLLAPYTEYGIDVGMTGSTSGWQTGIPYLNRTDNNFSGGTRYMSGTTGGGIGDDTMNNMSGDMVFHIDLDEATPGNPGYASPQNGGTVTGGNVKLSWTNLLANVGSDVYVDVWFGTDPVTDFTKVVNKGTNTTSHTVSAASDDRYYWRVDSYLNGAPTGTPAQGSLLTFYVDETGEPSLISALTALENHILGTPSLSSSQIAAHKATIDTHKSLFGSSYDVMVAAFDLVETYDTSGPGPLWVNQVLPDRSSVVDDIHWTVYNVMQAIVDNIYTNENVVLYEGLLDGYKFGSSAHFPGSVDPPSPIVTHTATINASYPDTVGWERQGDTLAARKPTGTYLAPGSIATVTVPPALVNSGYRIRVGAHSWDMSHRTYIRRLDRCTIEYQIDSTQVKVANPLGGGIYIEVPYRANAGIVTVDITGAVRSPYFSAKSFHTTTLSEWLNTERHHPGPWADFQSEKFMCQVPTNWIYNKSDPVTMMANWDAGIDVFNDLMGFPRDRGKETIYEQFDVINRSSVLAPGYPTVNSSATNPMVDSYGGDRTHYITRGPQIAPDYCLHEHGHAYFFPKFGGESESTVNLPHVAVWHQCFGYDLDYAFAASRGFQDNPHRTLNNTAVEWMTSFNFSPREVEMASGEKAYQLKGHAKFVDIAKLFGWQVLNDFWKSFVDDYENGIAYSTDKDSMTLRLSKAVGYDVRPLLHFWGIHPSSSLQAAIDAEGLFPSADIYKRLMEYKALVPANNAEFQTFALNWWGHQPNPLGLWTESEHGRQWDSTPWYVENNDVEQRPNGEIYVEASAADIQGRVQEIIDLYFPDGIPDYSVELSNMVGWSGEPTVLDPNIVNDAGSPLIYEWESDPTDGVSFSATNIEAPTVTITKPAGDMAIFTLELTISDGVDMPVRDTMTIKVYDDPCQAARLGMSLAADNPTDLNGDCITSFEDFAAVALKWLNNNGLASPQHK